MKKNYSPLSFFLSKGLALIVSLIIFLIITVIGLALFNNNTLLEKIAGSVLERQRAMHAAQSALLYAEWWLEQTSSVLTPVACNVTYQSIQVCNSPVPTSQATNILKLNMYRGYKPAGMSVNNNSTPGGLINVGNNYDVWYAQHPAIYIYNMGQLSNGTPVYQITAVGYGGLSGSSGALAIVQSIYSPISRTAIYNNLGD